MGKERVAIVGIGQTHHTAVRGDVSIAGLVREAAQRALDLDESVRVNPSGGALAANPVMAAGLIRLGEAAARIHRGDSDRALAHATSGPCLQQNLVAVLEGEPHVR